MFGKQMLIYPVDYRNIHKIKYNKSFLFHNTTLHDNIVRLFILVLL